MNTAIGIDTNEAHAMLTDRGYSEEEASGALDWAEECGAYDDENVSITCNGLTFDVDFPSEPSLAYYR